MFDDWWHFARGAYMDLEQDTPPQIVTLYYDPLLDVHHKLPVFVSVINALYLAPQRAEDARRLFDAGLGMLGAIGDGPPVVVGERVTAVALLLAREWGLGDIAARLGAGAEARYEPSWNRARGEFTWGFGLDEEHPRGQFNAIMAAAEAVERGAWTALATDRPADPGPQVVGVDFPTVAMRQAAWIDNRLHLSTSPMNDAVCDEPTAWKVTGLDDPARWTTTSLDGAPVETRVEHGDLIIETVVGTHSYEIRTS